MDHTKTHKPAVRTISGPTGTGTFDVENGGHLILGNTISGGETVDLFNGLLEFMGLAGRPSFTIAGPVYSGLPTISGLTAHSVIQIDGEAGG